MGNCCQANDDDNNKIIEIKTDVGTNYRVPQPIH